MKKKLNEVSTDCKLKVSLALEAACDVYGLQKKLVRSNSRNEEVIKARYSVYGLMVPFLDRQKFGLSDIGAIFGRDHAAVIHGKKEHIKLYTTNKYYKEKYDRIDALFDYKMNGGDPESNDAHALLRKIETTLEGLNEIKDMMLENYLSGQEIPETVKDVINETFPEYDKRSIIEKDLAGGIQISGVQREE
jgi:hypothetical protein